MLDRTALERSDGDDTFAEAAFHILMDIGQILSIALSTARIEDGSPRHLERNEAIVGGLLVRCYKLLHGLLDAASKQRLELVLYFVRGIAEAGVNVRYLLAKDDPETYDDFVRYSLRTDLELRGKIEANIEARSGDVLPIEERMLAGIENSFRLGEISPESIDLSVRQQRWGQDSIYGRFETLGLKDLYLAFFGVTSGYSHGNWHELYAHHLRHYGDGFELALDWSPTQPQPLAATGIMLLGATRDYLDTFPDNPDRRKIEGWLDERDRDLREVEELHEASLVRRRKAD